MWPLSKRSRRSRRSRPPEQHRCAMPAKTKTGRSLSRARRRDAAPCPFAPELERRLADLRSQRNGEHAPLYKSLEHLLRDSITAHELRPGTILPGETELADRCGISRVTVR